MIKPAEKAMSGEKINALIMSSRPPELMAPIPAPPITAPARDPINACEDEEGIPNHQVIRFQAIADMSAAITISTPLDSSAGFATPLPIVAATPVNVIAPTKFMTAARMMATLGLSARVDTEVAIAFAVS
ncbi:hypothetical protein D3C78_1039240 [compost metagenome]